MRVTLNLATLPSRRERYAFSWAVPLALLSAAGLIWIIYSGVLNIREYRHIQKDIAQMQGQNRRLSDRESDLRTAVEQPDYQAVAGKAQFLNSLIEQKRTSATDLAAKVSRLIPEDVHLTAMTLNQSKGSGVSFTVVGRNEEAVEKFLTALEDSPDFQDISVSSEGFQSRGESGGGVMISCTARYVGALVP